MVRAKLNNKGSAMISVIIVTTFITILATTILYSTSMNYMVKQNDYQNKRTFYQAEQLLDNLKAMLAQDVSEACEYAYRQTMAEYANLIKGGSSDNLTAYYNERYVKYLNELWNKSNIDGKSNAHKNVESEGSGAGALIAQYMKHSNESWGMAEDISGHIINGRVIQTDAPDLQPEPDVVFDAEDPLKGQFIIKGIIVSFTESGYTTYIKTDIVLNAPAYNWGGTLDEDMDSTLRMSDYIVYRNWEKY